MRRIKILVVDDDKIIRNSLSRMLGREYEVVLAADGKSALSILENNSFDCVISDIHMPGMNGQELLYSAAYESRLMRPDQFLFLTGKPSSPEADLVKAWGSIVKAKGVLPAEIRSWIMRFAKSDSISP